MPFDDDFWRAVADYAIKLPTAAALTGDPSPWLTEYLRVGRSAFASVLITASATEGGNASGSRQFPQATLIDALHCRRYDLDNDYELPPHLASYPEAKEARKRAGRPRVLKFSPC